MNTSLTGRNRFYYRRQPGHRQSHCPALAREGANIAIAAKTIEPHPKLEGTIYSVAAEIEAAGARALPLQVDIRDEDGVKKAGRANC
jgi:citronellol/citronellal dehydrogenase